MGAPMKPSRDYLTMTRAEAVREFGERQVKLRDKVVALPLPEKFRLVAEFLDAGPATVPLAIALSVARLALAELEEKA